MSNDVRIPEPPAGPVTVETVFEYARAIMQWLQAGPGGVATAAAEEARLQSVAAHEALRLREAAERALQEALARLEAQAAESEAAVRDALHAESARLLGQARHDLEAAGDRVVDKVDAAGDRAVDKVDVTGERAADRVEVACDKATGRVEATGTEAMGGVRRAGQAATESVDAHRDAALRTLEETTRTLLSELNDAGRAAVEAIEAARAEAEAALRELLNAQLQTLVAEAGRHRMDLADAAQHLASDLQSHTLSHLETLRQQAQLGLETLTHHTTSLTEHLSTVGQGVLDTLGRELSTAVGALQGAADEGRSWLRTLIEEGVATIIRVLPGGGVVADRVGDEVGDVFLGEDGNRRRG